MSVLAQAMKVKDLAQQTFKTGRLSLLQETCLYELLEAHSTDEQDLDLQAADSLVF
ncbi:MAG: hypothetical protein ACUVRV_07470 [Cyanobacteriota bacterium]